MEITDPGMSGNQSEQPEGQFVAPEIVQPTVELNQTGIPSESGINPQSVDQRPIDGIMPQPSQAFSPDQEQITNQRSVIDENTIPIGDPSAETGMANHQPIVGQEPVISEQINQVPVHPVDSSFGGDQATLEGVVGLPQEVAPPEASSNIAQVATNDPIPSIDTPPINQFSPEIATTPPEPVAPQMPEMVVTPDDQPNIPAPDLVVPPDQYRVDQDPAVQPQPAQPETINPIIPEPSIPPTFTYEPSVVNTTAEMPTIEDLEQNKELINNLIAKVNLSISETKDNMEKLTALMKKFNFDASGLPNQTKLNNPAEQGPGEL